MAAVSRQVRKCLLLALPSATRRKVFERFPNFRKAAPDGMKFVFEAYLGDLKVNVDTHFTVDKYMWTGDYEPQLTTLIRRQLKPGHVCFDIGANVGPVTLALARQVSPEGRVISIEASPSTFSRLQANLALNPSLEKIVTALNQGAGHEPGKLFWTAAASDPGNGVLGLTGDIEVPIVTVDAVAAAQNLARVDFMKVDVEGMELPVFRGAADTLNQFHPLLYFETLARFKSVGGSNFEEIARFLAKFGYRLYRPGTDGSLTETDLGNLASNTVALVPASRM